MTPAAFPWGGEPILMNGRNVGELHLGRLQPQLGRAVAMGYARAETSLTDELVLGAEYRVDIAGEHFAVTPHSQRAGLARRRFATLTTSAGRRERHVRLRRLLVGRHARRRGLAARARIDDEPVERAKVCFCHLAQREPRHPADAAP